jgi:hypothetical protein
VSVKLVELHPCHLGNAHASPPTLQDRSRSPFHGGPPNSASGVLIRGCCVSIYSAVCWSNLSTALPCSMPAAAPGYRTTHASRVRLRACVAGSLPAQGSCSPGCLCENGVLLTTPAPIKLPICPLRSSAAGELDGTGLELLVAPGNAQPPQKFAFRFDRVFSGSASQVVCPKVSARAPLQATSGVVRLCIGGAMFAVLVCLCLACHRRRCLRR